MKENRSAILRGFLLAALSASSMLHSSASIGLSTIEVTAPGGGGCVGSCGGWNDGGGGTGSGGGSGSGDSGGGAGAYGGGVIEVSNPDPQLWVNCETDAQIRVALVMGGIQAYQDVHGYLPYNATVEIAYFYDGRWSGTEHFVVLDPGESGWGLQVAHWNGCQPR